MSGNRKGTTSTVSRICSPIRERSRLVSNIAAPHSTAAGSDDDRGDDREHEQDDRQGGAVPDLRERDADPVDERAEELRRVARPAAGDEEGDVEGLQRSDGTERRDRDRRPLNPWQ